MNLQDKVILLTGASSGIGYSLAKLLPKENCSLALVARRKYLLDELAEEIATWEALKRNPKYDFRGGGRYKHPQA